jgi:hypothetical protein
LNEGEREREREKEREKKNRKDLKQQLNVKGRTEHGAELLVANGVLTAILAGGLRCSVIPPIYLIA